MQIGISISPGGGGRLAIPGSGLIAAWNLKAASASPIANLVSGATALTLPADPNAPTFTSAGLLFDGEDDYATAGQHPLGATGTVIVVARAAAAYPSDTADYVYRGLIAKTSSGATAGFSYSIDWNGDNAQRYLRLIVGNGSANNIPAAAFNLGGSSHHFIVGRWNGSHASIWAGGSKLNEVTQTVNANSDLDTPVKIGQVFSSATAIWDGEIAFAAIYNRGLSDAELRQARSALRSLLAPLSF